MTDLHCRMAGVVALLLALLSPGSAIGQDEAASPGAATSAAKPEIWTPLESGADATLRGLHAAGAGVVWVTGSKGTVLRTIDGGRSWKSVPPPGTAEFEFRDVEAWGAETAVIQVAGQPARFYRTTDGGKTWAVVYEHPGKAAFFDGFAFWPEENRLRGIAFSDPVDGRFLVTVTEDRGRSWTAVNAELLPEPRVGEAGFAASGTGVAVFHGGSAWIGMGGPSARILRTTDFGKRWSFSETSLRSGEPSAGVFSVAFRTPERGLAMGGDYRDEAGLEGTLVTTGDGGRSWHPGRGLSGFRSCVVWLPEWTSGEGGVKGAWLATGPLGTDLSVDDGATWRVLGDEGFHVLSVSSDGEIWAAGAEGRVARMRQE